MSKGVMRRDGERRDEGWDWIGFDCEFVLFKERSRALSRTEYYLF